MGTLDAVAMGSGILIVAGAVVGTLDAFDMPTERSKSADGDQK